MATLVTLLDVETEVESVWDTFLSSSPYSLGAIPSDTAAAVTTPRVEIVAEVIKWGPHQHTIASGTYSGRALYDQFLIRLSIAVHPWDAPESPHGLGRAESRVRFSKLPPPGSGLDPTNRREPHNRG